MLAVLASQHSVVSIDLSWKKEQTFIGDGWTIEGVHFEAKKVGGFQELWQHHPSVECAIGSVVFACTVLVPELYKSRIFDPLRSVGLKGKIKRSDNSWLGVYCCS